MYSSSFLSLKIFCIMAFFFWPQLCFENMIFRLHNILQHFYLLWPFLSLALETFKLLPFFPDKIKALSTFFFFCPLTLVCVSDYSLRWIPRSGITRSENMLCVHSWWAQPNCPSERLNSLHRPLAVGIFLNPVSESSWTLNRNHF